MPELHREEIRQHGADRLSRLHVDDGNPRSLSARFRQELSISLGRRDRVQDRCSSGSGGSPGPGSHQPERSGSCARASRLDTGIPRKSSRNCPLMARVPRISFLRDRDERCAGSSPLRMSIRRDPLANKEIWKIYRAAYKNEPFMRIVKENAGVHRYPEPKMLAGSRLRRRGVRERPHSRTGCRARGD